MSERSCVGGEINLLDGYTGKHITTLVNDIGWVSAIALTPYDKTLTYASCKILNTSCEESTINFVDMESGKHRDFTISVEQAIISLVYSADGNILAYVGCSVYPDSCGVNLWDVISNERLTGPAGEPDGITAIAISPNDNILAYDTCARYTAPTSCDKGAIKLWDVTKGKHITPLIGHSDIVSSVIFDRYGGSLVSASDDGTVIWWLMEGWLDSGNQLATGTQDKADVTDIALSPYEPFMASIGQGDFINLWNVVGIGEMEVVQTLYGGHEGTWDVAFNPNGSRLVSRSLVDMTLWDTHGVYEVVTESDFANFISSTNCSIDGAFSPDGNIFAAACFHNPYKRQVSLWDTSRGDRVATYFGREADIADIVFSSDGQTLVVAYDDQFITLWDLSQGEEMPQLEGQSSNIWAMAFDSDDKVLASASCTIESEISDDCTEGELTIWDIGDGVEAVNSGQIVATISQNNGHISSMVFSPDGKILASASCLQQDCVDVEVSLWDVLSGTQRFILDGHTSVVNSIAFSWDSNRVISADNDGTVIIWDVNSGDQLDVITNNTSIKSVALSPDGVTLVTEDWDAIKLWIMDNSQQLMSFPHGGNDKLLFSPDGTTLASLGGNSHLLNITGLPLMRQWIQENRYIREFTCEEREQFNMPAQCDGEGSFPTRTPYPITDSIAILDTILDTATDCISYAICDVAFYAILCRSDRVGSG